MEENFKNDAIEAIHNAASGMKKIDIITKESMLQFDESCIQNAEYMIETSFFNSVSDAASRVYDRACRTDFSAPGFALLRQSHIKDSLQHRRELVELKESLSDIHQNNSGKKLGWFTMSRFDQKNTTKLHRDGGPDQSLLILG